MRINVNTATEDELRTVPRLGKWGARQILDLRDAIGTITEGELRKLPSFRRSWLDHISFGMPIESPKLPEVNGVKVMEQGAVGGKPLMPMSDQVANMKPHDFELPYQDVDEDYEAQIGLQNPSQQGKPGIGFMPPNNPNPYVHMQGPHEGGYSSSMESSEEEEEQSRPEVVLPKNLTQSEILSREREQLSRDQSRFINEKIEIDNSMKAERLAMNLSARRQKEAAQESYRRDALERERKFQEDCEAMQERHSLHIKQQSTHFSEQLASFDKQLKALSQDNENLVKQRQADKQEIQHLRDLSLREPTEKQKRVDNAQKLLEDAVERTISNFTKRREYSREYSPAPRNVTSATKTLKENMGKLHDLAGVRNVTGTSDEDSDEDKLPTKNRGRSPLRSERRVRIQPEEDIENVGQSAGSLGSSRRSSQSGQKSFLAKLPILPKSIRFTGDTESSWPAFLAKFDSFTRVNKFTQEEKMNNFCWCLEGKASIYYAMVTKRNKDLEIDDLYRLFEARFDFKDLEETALLRFQSAMQGATEPLEEWADRCLQLADKAFKQYSTRHMTKQACMRYCQGAYDKKAGQCVANQRPLTMEAALEQMRLFQFTEQTIFPKSVGRKIVSEVAYVEDSEEDICVQAVTSNSKVPRPKTNYGNPRQTSSAVDDRLDVVEKNLSKLSTKMDLLLSTRQSRFRSPSPMRRGGRQSRSPSPRRFSDECFTCGQKGHYMAECPNKRVKFEQLKGTGSDVEA